MRTRLRKIALATITVAALSLQGCTVGCFTIEIPDFASKAVSGVWLWRLSPVTGVYERDTQFVFGTPAPGEGGERLDYQAAPTDGSPPLSLTAYVLRDSSNPDEVRLQLLFSRADDPAYYRASTYNGAGDSPLSSEIVPM